MKREMKGGEVSFGMVFLLWACIGGICIFGFWRRFFYLILGLHWER